MSGTTHDLLLVAVVAAVTIALRALPFILFPEGRKVPRIVSLLSTALPAAVMGMLVVYCLRNTEVLSWPYGLPELIAIAVVVALYVWKRNTVLSILAGTIGYMLLIQFVF